jgi:probable F420-dependent oxidoreductase
MAHDRKFRFGIQLSNAPAGTDWASVARRSEDQGFSTLFLPDHFGDQLAPLPAMMAAADATTELRVGALVFDNDYKHPVVLAKEVATVDVLSGGRVEFGVGAGWLLTDYEQAGMAYDKPGVRVDRMIEGLAVCKGLWGDGPFSYEGKHYRVTDLDGLPKPAQRPCPPILIGGGGKRVLTFAAQEADIVGINPNLRAGAVGPDAAQDAVATRIDEKLSWVREAAGDRFDALELNMLVFVGVVTDDRQGFIEAMAGGFGVTPEQAVDIPYAWAGTIDEICEHLETARDRWGVSYYVLQGDAAEAMVPVVAKLAGT